MIARLVTLTGAAPMWDFSAVESMQGTVIAFLVIVLTISIFAGIGWFLIGIFRGER